MPTTSVFTMAAMCRQYISECGYSIEDNVITNDLADEIESLPSRLAITSILSPRANDFTAKNSFWLIIRHGSQIVGTLGARFDDIDDDDVGTHLTNLHNRHFAGDPETKVVSRLPKSAKSITGGIVYMGDVFFAPGHRGDMAKTQCFCQYAYCLAFARWWDRAGWIIALHRKADYLAGKVAEYGFTTDCFPAAQNWINAPDGRSGSEHLSVLSKEHFLRNIGNFIDDPESLVAPPIRRR